MCGEGVCCRCCCLAAAAGSGFASPERAPPPPNDHVSLRWRPAAGSASHKTATATSANTGLELVPAHVSAQHRQRNKKHASFAFSIFRVNQLRLQDGVLKHESLRAASSRVTSLINVKRLVNHSDDALTDEKLHEIPRASAGYLDYFLGTMFRNVVRLESVFLRPGHAPAVEPLLHRS